MYVGERSMYGMKLVNMCQGSNERTLEKKYTVQEALVYFRKCKMADVPP